MDRLAQDVRFAVRLLIRDRVFTATTLLTLAVCIGANAAIFAVVNSVLLEPLPVPPARRLVLLHNSYPRAGVERASNGVPDYFDRLREIEAFDEQALYNTSGLTLGTDGSPQRVLGMVATPSLLRLLEVRPLHGRIFTDAEGEPGNQRKAMLTWELWQQLFAGSPGVVGRDVRINSLPYTVVGILPQGFHFLNPEVRLWIPAAFTPEDKSDDARHSNNWSMVGRLKPGATVEQAQQQLDALNARNLERFPHLKEILTNAGFHSVARLLHEDLVRDIRSTLYLLWGGVLFVLLIGVVNITNLVLVRASGRAREIATRHALGAAINRLTRQLLTETLLLTAVGGALGLAVGYWGVGALGTLGLDRMPRGSEVRLDTTAALFTLGLASAVGVIVGLVPVFNLRQINLSQTFREESRSGTNGLRARVLRRTLVTAQVAFAFMLLIGAGLLLASFQRVLAIHPGFEPANVLTARISLPRSRYADDTALRTFGARLLDRVRALPGVEQAGLTSNLPFGGDYSDSVILAEGYKAAPGESLISPFQMTVSPGYFEAMRIGLSSGRSFTEGDTENSPGAVIVDERLARRFWGDLSPVGRRMFKPGSAQDLISPGPTAQWFTVVGVVSEIRISGLIETEDRLGAYYFPAAQNPARNLTLALRSGLDRHTLAGAIRRVLGDLDPELPLFGIATMEERMATSLTDRRTPLVLSVAFAGVALFLAALGLYGVLAYQVTQRSREIGIRIALGSDPRRVFRLILSEGLTLLALGLTLGILGAFSIRSILQSQLYGVAAMDPAVLGAVAGVMLLVAVVACAVPARRAARIDPVTALSA